MSIFWWLLPLYIYTELLRWWILNSYLQFFQLDGCAVDAASYAAYAVLNTARYPQTELIDGESGTPEDFELSSDLSLARMLPLSRHGVPIVVSVAQVRLICCIYVVPIFIVLFDKDWIKYHCRLWWAWVSLCEFFDVIFFWQPGILLRLSERSRACSSDATASNWYHQCKLVFSVPISITLIITLPAII